MGQLLDCLSGVEFPYLDDSILASACDPFTIGRDGTVLDCSAVFRVCVNRIGVASSGVPNFDGGILTRGNENRLLVFMSNAGDFTIVTF